MGEVRAAPLGAALIPAWIVLIAIPVSPFPANIRWTEAVFLLIAAFAVRTGALWGWRPHFLDGLVVLYLVGSLPSLLTSPEPMTSALQFAKHVYLALVYLVFSRLLEQRPHLQLTCHTLVATATAVATVGVLGLVAWYALGIQLPGTGTPMPMPYVGQLFRLHGTFHSFEMLGNFLAVALPLAVASAAGGQGWRWAVVALLAVAALFTLGHAWVGIAAAALIALWPRWAGRPTLRGAAVVAVLALAVGVNAMLMVSVREVRYEQTTNPRLGQPSYPYAFQPDAQGPPMVSLSVSYNWMSYAIMKALALEAFARKPFTGIGLGRFHDETERAYRAGRVNDFYRATDPHSTLPGRLAETGLPGGVTLVTLWAGVLWLGARAVTRQPTAWPVRAILAGLVGLLVNSVNADVMNFRFLWLGVAMLRAEAMPTGGGQG